MKTKRIVPWQGAAVLAALAPTTLSAQSLTSDPSTPLGLSAAGGVLVLLLAWANRLRRAGRPAVPGAPQTLTPKGPPPEARAEMPLEERIEEREFLPRPPAQRPASSPRAHYRGGPTL